MSFRNDEMVGVEVPSDPQDFDCGLRDGTLAAAMVCLRSSASNQPFALVAAVRKEAGGPRG